MNDNGDFGKLRVFLFIPAILASICLLVAIIHNYFTRHNKPAISQTNSVPVKRGLGV